MNGCSSVAGDKSLQVYLVNIIYKCTNKNGNYEVNREKTKDEIKLH